MTHPLQHLTPDQIEAKVRAAISRAQCGRPVNEAIGDELEIDSLGVVEISIEVEDEFDIDVPDKTLEEFEGKTIFDWCELAAGLIGAGEDEETVY